MGKWVLIAVGGLWPLIAFTGGLGYSPLIAIGGVLCIWKTLPKMKLRLYMIALLAALEFMAASARWSPRPITLFDLDLADGSFAIRLEVLRLGLSLLWGSVLIDTARSLSPADARLIIRVATIAIFIQLISVALLALFEKQALDFFYPKLNNEAEGVQNISRNSILMALAAPSLIVGIGVALGRTMTFARGLLVELVVFLGIIAVLLARGVDAGIVSVIIGIGCVGLIRLFPRIGFKILGALIAFTIVATPLIFGWLTRTFGGVPITDSASWRLAIWTRVLKIIGQDPVFGQGLGVLRTVQDKIQDGPMKGIILVPNHAHNMILQLWAESGAIGATLLAIAVLCAGFRMPEPRRLGSAGFLAAALAGQYTVICLVSFDLWNDLWWSAAICLAALAVVMARVEAYVPPALAAPAPGPDPGAGADRDLSGVAGDTAPVAEAGSGMAAPPAGGARAWRPFPQRVR